VASANNVSTFLLRPFFIGLYIGLAGCLLIFIREKFRQRRLKKEIENLKHHIQLKLEIEAEVTERKKLEIEQLKDENENLRVTLQSYYQKPGRRELRQLQVYQKAIEVLTEKAPGFAPSWQSALRDGEEEIRKSERGIIPLMKRLLPGGSHAHSIEDRGDKKSQK
jgi:uncharacterized membrane protein YciS (DUF1049 family)